MASDASSGSGREPLQVGDRVRISGLLSARRDLIGVVAHYAPESGVPYTVRFDDGRKLIYYADELTRAAEPDDNPPAASRRLSTEEAQGMLDNFARWTMEATLRKRVDARLNAAKELQAARQALMDALTGERE